jgi:hypothetical protein
MHKFHASASSRSARRVGPGSQPEVIWKVGPGGKVGTHRVEPAEVEFEEEITAVGCKTDPAVNLSQVISSKRASGSLWSGVVKIPEKRSPKRL